MRFERRSAPPTPHATLSPSNYHWINYDTAKMAATFRTAMAAKRGVELHELAHKLIALREYLPEAQRTINLYVNDALRYKMKSEFLLYYSDNCFGTADAISQEDNLLRIHDLKTGISPTSEKQLYVYAALFCLGDKNDPNSIPINPHDLKIELRIYQLDEIRVYYPDPDDIVAIMKKIVEFDQLLEKLKQEEQAW